MKVIWVLKNHLFKVRTFDDSILGKWNDAEGQKEVSKKGGVEHFKEDPDLILEGGGSRAGHHRDCHRWWRGWKCGENEGSEFYVGGYMEWGWFEMALLGFAHLRRPAGHDVCSVTMCGPCQAWAALNSVQSFSHVWLFVTPGTVGFPVHHQLPESTQTHVHWVGDAIQISHPLSSPSPPALTLSQHQGLFKWVSPSHQVAKVSELQLPQCIGV